MPSMRDPRKWWPVVALSCAMGACSTPADVSRPSQDVLDAHRIAVEDISKLPAPVTRIMGGDTVRIVRDAQEQPDLGGTANLYVIRPDGTLSYPYAGTIKAAGMTPEALAAEIAKRQAAIYREPSVTVNIATAPGNRVYVGGAVRQPSAYDLSGTASLDQALIAAGGLLQIGDSHHIALLRQDADGLYQVYFADFSKLLTPSAGYRPIPLQRGDVVFVPNSLVGAAVQDIDLYLYQLIPFSRQVGLGFAYQLNNTHNTLDVQQRP